MSKTSNPNSDVSTGARQTMRSWARTIESVEDLPETYQAEFLTLVGERKTMPYTVLAPLMDGPGSTKAERLLCEVDDTFYILELAGGQINIVGFHYNDIHSLEVGNILLYSWFTVNGKTMDGRNAVVTVEFNDATVFRFEPFWKRIRPAATEADDQFRTAQKEKFDFLMQVNFKYMNFGRQCLTPGEQVIRVVYQPLCKKTILSILRHPISRILFMSHLAILTDQELILIGEAEHVAEKMRGKYGGVWQYLPLRSIGSVELGEQADGYWRLSIALRPDKVIEKSYEASRVEDVEGLVKAIDAAREATGI